MVACRTSNDRRMLSKRRIQQLQPTVVGPKQHAVDRACADSKSHHVACRKEYVIEFFDVRSSLECETDHSSWRREARMMELCPYQAELEDGSYQSSMPTRRLVERHALEDAVNISARPTCPRPRHRNGCGCYKLSISQVIPRSVWIRSSASVGGTMTNCLLLAEWRYFLPNHRNLTSDVSRSSSLLVFSGGRAQGDDLRGLRHLSRLRFPLVTCFFGLLDFLLGLLHALAHGFNGLLSGHADLF